ncbi:MAG: hypothetical protein ABI742_12640, partial [Gemmatimonadota bacterium]
EALRREWRQWDGEVEEVRRWRRPLWLLLLIGTLVLGVAGYVGLVLGGYLPVPGLLAATVERIWAAWN